MEKERVLKVEDLTVSFKTNQGMVRAVRGIDFELYKGETLAIVGESGSGKSVSSRTIMGILAGNGVIDKGRIMYNGQDLTKVDEEHYHEIRGNKIGMIFQDPMSSLNPIMRIGKQITEGMLLNGNHLKERAKKLSAKEKNALSLSKVKLAELKAERKNLKEDKENPSKNALLAEINNNIADAKGKVAEAKALYNKSLKKAEKQVKDEWKAEKNRVKELIDANKLELKSEGTKAEAVELNDKVVNLRAENKSLREEIAIIKKQQISDKEKQSKIAAIMEKLT
ncbi:MAG: ATP-binding cassette domain-containing protein, partial [Sphaerochaetaceae bacterium]|nr:ATP-binding cassette domain-containing protein [Sphaerochaetaceae bacterium]